MRFKNFRGDVGGLFATDDSLDQRPVRRSTEGQGQNEVKRSGLSDGEAAQSRCDLEEEHETARGAAPLREHVRRGDELAQA